MSFFKYFLGFLVSYEHLLLPDPVLALICICAGLISNCQPLRFWGLLRDMTVGYKLKYIREGMGIGDMRLKDMVGGGDGWTPLAHRANLLDVTPFMDLLSSLSSRLPYRCFLVSFINILESLSHGTILGNPNISLFWFCLV